MKILLALFAAATLALAVLASRLGVVLSRSRRENARLREVVALSYRHGLGDIEELRRLRHDMRHYALLSGAPSPSSGTEGDGVIGALVEHYSGLAAKLGVTADLGLRFDGCEEDLVADLCLVLSNLLENAVEALRGQESGWLRGRSYCAEGYVSLVIGNSCAARLRRRHGAYLSGKARGRAGLGLATIQDVARRHGGKAVFRSDGRMFTASVFIPKRIATDEP